MDPSTNDWHYQMPSSADRNTGCQIALLHLYLQTVTQIQQPDQWVMPILRHKNCRARELTSPRFGNL